MAIDFQPKSNTTIDFQPKNKEKKENFGQMFVREGLVKPGLATLSAFQNASASFYETLDAVTKLGQNTFGGSRGGLFEEWAKNIRAEAKKTEEKAGYVTPVAKFGYDIIGGSIPYAAEFALLPGGFVTKSAVSSALKEYGQTEDLSGLATGAVQGAGTAAALQLTPKLAGKAGQLAGIYGKKAARAYIKALTGSESLADDFVNNYKKYDVSIIAKKKYKDVDVVKAENKLKLSEVKADISNKKSALVEQRKILQKEITDNKNEAMFRLDQAKKDSKDAFLLNKKEKLEEAVIKLQKGEEQIKDSLNREATNLFDEVLIKSKQVRDAHGKAVENAENILIQNEPTAGIKASIIKKRLESVEKNISPFPSVLKEPKSQIINTRGQQIEVLNPERMPRTGVRPDPSDYKQFRDVMDDINVYESGENISIKYLQDLKKRVYSLRDHYSQKGDYELSRTYSAIYDAINPAKVVTDNPELNRNLAVLAEANSAYVPIVRAYDKAMKLYFKEDVTKRELIPDVGKVIRAVKANDRTMLKEFNKADQLLQPEDRLLPRVKSLLSDAEKAMAEEDKVYRYLKATLDKQQKELVKRQNEQTHFIKKKYGQESFNKKMEQMRNEKEIIGREQDYYNALKRKIDEQEREYSWMMEMRRLRPSSESYSRVVQNYIGFGVFLPMSFKPLYVAGSVALMPRVAGNVIKKGTAIPEFLYHSEVLLNNTINNKLLRPSVISNITNPGNQE